MKQEKTALVIMLVGITSLLLSIIVLIFGIVVTEGKMNGIWFLYWLGGSIALTVAGILLRWWQIVLYD